MNPFNSLGLSTLAVDYGGYGAPEPPAMPRPGSDPTAPTVRSMAEPKTVPTTVDVDAFVAAIEPDPRREDATALLSLFRETTGEAGTIWGSNIVGFGSYDYRYASGRTGTSMRVGFAARKDRVTVYLPDGFDSYEELLGKLGPHTNGKSCLHIKRLAQIELEVLETMIARSFATPMPGEVDG